MTGEESTTIPTMSSYEELSHILRSNIFPSVGGEWRTSTGSTYTGHDIKSSEVARDTTHFRHKDWLGKWHERDIYRLSILKASQERLNKGSTKPLQLPPVISPHKTLAKTNLNNNNKPTKRTKLPPVK